MQDNLIIAYKKLGQTPLKCLEDIRIKHNIGINTPMTYAGRLDPMAEGLLIILVGEECKNKNIYLDLNKTYEFEILVGFETDTYDLLGIIKKSFSNVNFLTNKNITDFFCGHNSVLNSFIGTFNQKYPAFSSKTINGKKLFQLSKDQLLPDVLPEHQVNITKLEYKNNLNIERHILQNEILSRINLIKGDFRQKEIIDSWNSVLINSNQNSYTILSFSVECSSGTYVRQLTKDISDKIGIPLVTYSIKRTKIGKYCI